MGVGEVRGSLGEPSSGVSRTLKGTLRRDWGRADSGKGGRECRGVSGTHEECRVGSPTLTEGHPTGLPVSGRGGTHRDQKNGE